MTFQNSVTIGREFFAKAFNDYSNKYWAFARELMQNSIDCGSTRVDVWVFEDPVAGTTGITVENDGEPMSSDTLVNKLLALGASGKDFNGAVGGFGRAKEILYFAQKSYTIRTGGLQVEGSGAGYNLTEAAVPCAGTMSHVTWDGLHASILKSQFLRFIELCGTKGIEFTVNAEAVLPKLGAGTLNRTLDFDGNPWAEIRLSDVEPNLLVVRVDGNPMFKSWCEHKGTVVLELLGTSAQRLTANRDGLRYPFSEHLREFITSIAVDRKTVFKLEKAEYTRLAGDKLQRPREVAEPTWVPEVQVPRPVAVAASVASAPASGGGIVSEVVAREEIPQSPLGHEFILKNCVKRAVPKEYNPATFGRYAAWLARSWAACLLELHDLYRIDKPFSVGFVFDEQCGAQSESTSEYGQVYYLNPCKVTKESHTRKFTKSDRFDVLSLAGHEFVHGEFDLGYHNEDFASKYTEVMGVVMKHFAKFSRHFK